MTVGGEGPDRGLLCGKPAYPCSLSGACIWCSSRANDVRTRRRTGTRLGLQLQSVMQERFSNVNLQSLDPQFKYNIYRFLGLLLAVEAWL